MKNKAIIFIVMLLVLSPAAFALVWQDPYWGADSSKKQLTIDFGASATAASGSFNSISKTIAFKVELRKNSGALVKTLVQKNVDVSKWTGYETVTITQADYQTPGIYYVKFTLNDGQQPAQSKQVTLTVKSTTTPTNNKPIITCPGSKTVNENQFLDFYVSGSDPDAGDTISFSASNLPSGSSFDSSAKKFSWTPNSDQSGTYTMSFTVKDNHGASSSCTVQITVLDDNKCPVLSSIGNKKVMEGNTLSFTVSASDADGDSLTYSASGLPFSNGAAFDANTRIFTWTTSSSDVGLHDVTFSATDNKCSQPAQEKITIEVTSKNTPVASLSAVPTEGPEGTTVTFSCTATGGDSPLSYELDFADGSAKVSAQTATHQYNKSGEYKAACKVTDADLDSDTATATINITDNKPTVKLVATPVKGNSPLAVDFDCQVTGGNAPLTYTLDFGDGSSSTSGKDKHTYTAKGKYVASCTVLDADNDLGYDATSINVSENACPVLAPIGDKKVQVGKDLNFTLSAADADGDTLFYNVSMPFMPFIESKTGKFSWTPVALQVGNHTATFLAEDGTCGDKETININVTAAPKSNTAPKANFTWSPKPAKTGQVITFKSTSTDPENDSLTCEWDIDGDGSADEKKNCTTDWTFTKPGNYSTNLTVSDGNLSDSITIKVEVLVNVTNQKPKADFTWTPAKPKAGDSVKFNSTSTDPDNDTLTCAWDLDNDGFTDSTKCAPTKVFNTPGNHSVKLTVNDGKLSDSITKKVQVTGQLNVTNIKCFSPVIEKSLESCSVKVEGSNSLAVGNANVKLYYKNGTLLKNGITDTITGNTVVTFPTGSPGNYTVYATAEKPGWISDLDKTPTDTFEVFAKKYLISNLAVYNSSTFAKADEDYDFFRDESMYVHFIVLDKDTGKPADNLVTSVSLISPPGGVAWFSKYAYSSPSTGSYYYNLKIPKTHEFLGSSQVFTFAFNFTDKSGAQMVVQVTIRNNPPKIDNKVLNEFNSTFQNATTISLTPYESDVEDSGSNLTWSVLGVDTKVAKVAVDKDDNLTITPVAAGYDIVSLVLTDLDGATATIDVPISTSVAVKPQCSDGVDNDGDKLVDFPADKGCTNSTDNNETDPVVPPTKTQCNDGVDNDKDGKIDMKDPGCTSLTDDDENEPVVNLTANVTSGIAPLSVAFVCNVTGGDSPLSYVLDFGDGSSTTSSSAVHNYSTKGVYKATCNVTDLNSDAGYDSLTITVSAVSVTPQCSDGKDNDGDGFVDKADPGCWDSGKYNASDTNETDTLLQCANFFDDDGDGLIDLADLGCANATDNNESDDPVSLPQCSDGVDNDNDGWIDWPYDLGCTNSTDTNETDPTAPAECNDGIDNDKDGWTDYPADKGCTSKGDTNESDDPVAKSQCSDGKDNDGDSLVDKADPGCWSSGKYDANDDNESDDPTIKPQCSDGKDNDGDGLTDYPADLGCSSPLDNDETDVAGNQPPIADIKLSRAYGAPGVVVTADGSKSSDPDGSIASHSWFVSGPNNYTFTDSKTGTPGSLTIKFDAEGTYSVRLTVVDNKNATDTETKSVKISSSLAQCDNGIDDDGDGKVDLADPHCASKTDTMEGEIFIPAPDRPWRDQDDLLVTRIDVNGYDVESYAVSPGNYLRLGFGLQNNLDYTLDDIKVDASIQDLGIRDSDMLRKLSPGDSANVVFNLDIPSYAEPGLYDVRFVISNDDVRRVKYRTITIA